MFTRIAVLVAMTPLAAAAQTFQPGRLAATSRDSFDVVYQGQPIGAFVMSHTRAGDNVTFITEARIAQMGVTEVDTIVFNATTLMPVLMTNNQSMQGMSMAGRVTIAEGKATGTIQQPGAGGIETMPVSATIAAGVIADGAEALLIPTLDFSDQMTVNYKTFDHKAGRTKDYSLKILGKETVTVPIGAIESWKAEITGDDTVQVWVSTADPKKVVMLRLASAQVEMKRAK